MATRAEKKKQYKIDHREELNEKKRLYYQQNKELLKEKEKLKKEALTEEEKQAIKEKSKESWEKNKDKHSEKITCDICKTEVSRKCMNKHKQSLKCQSHIPNHDIIPLKKVKCERCGKEVSATSIDKHMNTIQCGCYPALQLNVPMKVITHRIKTIPKDMTYFDLLNQICEEYKDGYVEPPKPVKEKKPWQIEREAFDKALQNKEVVLSDGSINPLYQKYFL